MSHAAVITERNTPGIHAVDGPVAVMLLRSGSGFHVACSECRHTIARDLPDADLQSQAGSILRHRMECAGPRGGWMRRMIRMFALS
jgi:hypothetical protein